MSLFCTVCELYSQILVENRGFNLPHLNLAPLSRVTPLEFRRYLWHQKTRRIALSCGIKILPVGVVYNDGSWITLLDHIPRPHAVINNVISDVFIRRWLPDFQFRFLTLGRDWTGFLTLGRTSKWLSNPSSTPVPSPMLRPEVDFRHCLEHHPSPTSWSELQFRR